MQAFEVIELGDITNNSGMKSFEKNFKKEKQYADIKDE